MNYFLTPAAQCDPLAPATCYDTINDPARMEPSKYLNIDDLTAEECREIVDMLNKERSAK